ncbi:MAG TPA: aromatic-ring-hydroxylating dioxygenase subunit beta, partial [Chloroflexota bacterium]|nr:aromatic-ring-hydroxylating dioxygenase subunit beta [Chloroflexota bacterium]
MPQVSDADYRQCLEFLFHEAELLDNLLLPAWLELLTPDIDYRVPVRATVNRSDATRGVSATSYHLLEDYGSLSARVARFDTAHAWAEDPPSRVRRFVSNFRIEPADRPE